MRAAPLAFLLSLVIAAPAVAAPAASTSCTTCHANPDLFGAEAARVVADFHHDVHSEVGLSCHDCVVTVLLGPPPELSFDSEEQEALEVLAGSGLVPPLRMVTPVSGPEVESA